MAILWLRRLIRRNFPPIDRDKASRWRQYLSMAYSFTAMNLFLYVVYESTMHRADTIQLTKDTPLTDVRPAVKWAQRLNLEKVKVMTYTSGGELDSYEIIKGVPSIVSKKEEEEDDDI